MKMKRKQIGMLVFIAIIVILMVVTSQTPGTIADADSYQCKVYATILSLLPPVIAIGLALITKEVYTSLLAGIIVGGLLYSNFNLELMLNTILFQEEGGMIYKLSDAGNVGILVFLVMLGILVSLLNRAGGSAAFGKWASRHIKTRIGAQISGKAGGCLGGVFAGQNAQRQRDHSHQKGEQAVLEDGVHIALFNALIDDKGHDGGQKHIHHGFQSGKERCQDCGAFILAQMRH